MDLDDFKAFLAIYKHGSISKAAASLYMNQSNLSSKIQKLEKLKNIKTREEIKEIKKEEEHLLNINKKIEEKLII